MSIHRHWAYLKYVIRHKIYVFEACMSLDVPFWRAVVHDWTKFLPCEWLPYAETFYKPDGSKQYAPTTQFNFAWLHHQKWNPHHWQYWLLRLDAGETLALDMPLTYIEEMVSDWVGAGKAITGRMEVKEWYTKNREKIVLSEATRLHAEYLIDEFEKRELAREQKHDSR